MGPKGFGVSKDVQPKKFIQSECSAICVLCAGCRRYRSHGADNSGGQPAYGESRVCLPARPGLVDGDPAELRTLSWRNCLADPMQWRLRILDWCARRHVSGKCGRGPGRHCQVGDLHQYEHRQRQFHVHERYLDQDGRIFLYCGAVRSRNAVLGGQWLFVLGPGVVHLGRWDGLGDCIRRDQGRGKLHLLRDRCMGHRQCWSDLRSRQLPRRNDAHLVSWRLLHRGRR